VEGLHLGSGALEEMETETQAQQAAFIRAITLHTKTDTVIYLSEWIIPIIRQVLKSDEKYTRIAALSALFTMIQRDVPILNQQLDEIEKMLLLQLQTTANSINKDKLQDCEEQLFLIKEFAMLTGRTPDFTKINNDELQALIVTIIQPPRIHTMKLFAD
jgi:hypothetical protein